MCKPAPFLGKIRRLFRRFGRASVQGSQGPSHAVALGGPLDGVTLPLYDGLATVWYADAADGLCRLARGRWSAVLPDVYRAVSDGLGLYYYDSDARLFVWRGIGMALRTAQPAP